MKNIFYKNSLFLFCLFVLLLQGNSLLAQVPTITSFSPTNQQIGLNVTITGTNFSPTSNDIYFGTIKVTAAANVVGTSITVAVPAGASSVTPIVVRNNSTGLQVSSLTIPSNTTKLFNVITTPTIIPNYSSTTLTTSATPHNIEVADFNKDGNPDVIAAYPATNNVAIRFGNGTGGFGAETPFTVGQSPQHVSVADFNGDGNMDFVAVNGSTLSANYNVTVRLGNGIGGFGVPVDYNAGTKPPTNNAPYSSVVADVDNDGDIDIIVTNRGVDAVGQIGTSVSTLKNNGNGVFSLFTTTSVASYPNILDAGDFNNDGKIDIAVPNLYSSSVSILIGDGIGNFSSSTTTAGNYPKDVKIADFNNDGNMDMVVSRIYNNASTVHFGNGAGGFSSATTLYSGHSHASVVADFDGDGNLDVAFADLTTSAIKVFLGTGTTAFGSAYNFGVSGIEHIKTADFNKDGKTDLVISNATGLEVLLWSLPPTQPKGNRGLYFDGVDDYVQVPNISFGGSNPYTIESWVKISEYGIGKTILGKAGSGGGTLGISLFIDNLGRVIFATDCQGCPAPQGGWKTYTTPTSVVIPNQWVHVSVTNTGTTKHIYINGIEQTGLLVGGTADDAAALPSTNNWQFGRPNYLPSSELKGQLDEVRIFGSARSQTQIQTDMAATTQNGEAGFWRFEETTGQSVLDEIMVNNGTLGATGTVEGSDPLRALRVTNTLGTGAESFRNVIGDANNFAGKNYIDFSIPITDPNYSAGVWTIQPNNGQYLVTEEALIDGYSAFGSKSATALLPATIVIQVSQSSVSSNTIRLQGSTSSTLKGLSIAQSVSNGLAALWLDGTAGHKIEGNYIGVNAAGTAFYPSRASDALVIQSSSNNTIGGTTPEKRNIISGAFIGIRIDGATSNNNTILGNYIGVQANGTSALGSRGEGILINASTSGQNNRIGDGTLAGANIIANNGFMDTKAGIEITDISSINNPIRYNFIYNNTNGGILLSGGNTNKPAPTINPSSTTTLVSGTCTTCVAGEIIELFRDNVSSIKQGKEYLSSTTVTTGGIWSISSFTNAPVIGDYLTATLTDGAMGDGNTSPFSTPVLLAGTFYSRDGATNITTTGANWNDANSWTLSSTHSGTPSTVVPPAGATVYIKTGHKVIANTDFMAANNNVPAAIYLEGELNLQNGNHTGLNTATVDINTYGSNTGKLLIGGGTAAASITSTAGSFLTTAGNVVEFYGNGVDYAIPHREYPTLTITGTTSIKSMLSGTSVIHKDLIVETGARLDVAVGSLFDFSNTADHAITHNGEMNLGGITINQNTIINSGGIPAGVVVRNDLTIASGTLTNNGVISINSATSNLTGAGSFVAGGNSVLYYNSNNDITLAGTFNVNTNPNTVVYQSGTASPYITTTYDRLIFRNSRNVIGDIGANVISFDDTATPANIVLANGTTITVNSLTNTNSSPSTINFGTGNSSMTINGNMDGGTTLNTLNIIHNPSPTTTQLLDLKGSTNTLNSFTYTGTGTSIVRYSSIGVNQSIFSSTDYQNLEIVGGFIKALQGPTTVNRNLILTNGILDLGIGSNNLTLGTAATIGGTPSTSSYIATRGTGSVQKLISGGTGSFTFPISFGLTSSTYAPVTANYNSSGLSAITAKVAPPSAPTITGTNKVNAVWSINRTGLTLGNLIFNWQDVIPTVSSVGAIGTGATIYRDVSSVWTTASTDGNSVSSISNNSATLVNADKTGNFAVFENPVISVSTTTLTAFTTCAGTPSGEQSYTVSGTGLTTDISIVPPAGFEISTGTGGSFVATNPIILPQTSGTVNPTLIYVRLSSTTAGSYGGIGNDIIHTSTGATNQNVAIPISTVTPVTSISNQPANQTVVAGNNTSFSVSATGTGTLTYMWQVSIDGGASFSNLTNTGVYSTVTTATLTITTARADMNANRYRCIVNSDCGTATSNAAILTVNCPTITLSTLPNGTLNASYNQTITVIGGTSPYTYSFIGTLPTGLNLATTGGNINGTPTQAGTYPFDITVTDANGCTATQSYTVTIDNPTIVLGSITPTPNSYCVGTSITVAFTVPVGAFNTNNIFTVQLSDASGDFTNQISLSSNTLNATGDGSITFAIPVGTPAGTGYIVRVVSDDPSVISNLSSPIEVYPIPTLSTNSTSQAICSGTNTNIALSGTATTYSWTASNTSGNVSIPNTSGTRNINQPISELLTGSGIVTYTITPIANGCSGSPINVVVTVNPLPNVTLLITSNTPVCPNSDVNFEATVSPILTGTYTYDFVVNGVSSQNTNSNTFTRNGLVTGDVVTVTVTDPNGCTSSSSITMIVADNQAPTLTPMPNFTRNTDQTNCYYTNRTTTTSTRIPDGIASDNCGVASYRYLLSGATLGDLSSLEGIRFNKGVTTVSWTATDRNDNVSSPNQFTITVVDAQSPVIQAPQNVTRTTNLYGCTSTRDNINIGTPTVTDNCLFRVFNNAPTEFPVGETIVIWTAVDSAGNSSTAEQIVTIREQYYVTPSDSLILVQIYNEMGGENWTHPWNLNTPVSTWGGIAVSCGKVAAINLSSNNLTGVLPSSVLNLARRTERDFALNIGGNRLSFESAEDFVGLIPNFTYSPQAKIYSTRTETVGQSEFITLTSQTEGDFNTYQWYKDQTPISGATDWSYTIASAVPSDAGVYVCEVKNTVATQLILERNPITLEVEGFVNPSDSLVLVQIFQETGGPTTWIFPWDLTTPVATWEGVTLSGGKIRELDLSSRELRGILPNVFDSDFFSELRYLSFFDNNLEGQIPASLGSITTLTYLDLDKNKFEGSVPASFGNLVNLQSLWLSRNNLTNLPDEIGNMRSLRTLYLNDNKFTELPETIGNLSELLVLNVSDNELRGLPNSITNLRKLIQFYANRNYISSLPTTIQNLVALTVFEINTNNLTALPSGFLQMSSLSKFRVSENELEFDDLLPYSNRTYDVFDYAPQAPINEEEDILATLNTSVSFTVQTQGSGNNYQWFRNGTSVATTQTLTINRVSTSDVGIYIADVTNPSLPNLTLKRRSIILNVECQAGLNFEINQPTQTIFCEGQPFGLKLEINNQFTDARQIRWRKDGVVLAFASERTYTVTQAGRYTAEVLTANGCTALSNAVEISVLPQPEVSINLENETVFRSSVTSQESVTYQWLKDGAAIEDAFESTYTPTETGEYSLLVLTESGCSSVSETIIFTQRVTGIDEPKELRNLEIFPNPNNGNFFIDFGTNTPNGEPTFILIDAIGRKVVLKTEKISSTRYKVITNKLTGGMYHLQIQTKDGLAFRKFVIEE